MMKGREKSKGFGEGNNGNVLFGQEMTQSNIVEVRARRRQW